MVARVRFTLPFQSPMCSSTARARPYTVPLSGQAWGSGVQLVCLCLLYWEKVVGRTPVYDGPSLLPPPVPPISQGFHRARQSRFGIEAIISISQSPCSSQSPLLLRELLLFSLRNQQDWQSSCTIWKRRKLQCLSIPSLIVTDAIVSVYRSVMLLFFRLIRYYLKAQW